MRLACSASNKSIKGLIFANIKQLLYYKSSGVNLKFLNKNPAIIGKTVYSMYTVKILVQYPTNILNVIIAMKNKILKLRTYDFFSRIFL